jgi:hypothetical protein
MKGFADKMVVGLLKLELLSVEEKPSPQEYSSGKLHLYSCPYHR